MRPGIGFATLAAACVFIGGCAKPEEPPPIEEPPPAQPAQPAGEARKPDELSRVQLTPPQPTEARAKADQVFKGAVHPDEDRDGWVFVGDFNGDQSQDIALVVKPVKEKLPEINHEFAPWIRTDGLAGVLPESVVRTQGRGPAKVGAMRIEDGDRLLAVIHGHGPAGWRDTEALQSYLVKNIVGGKMRARTRDQAQSETDSRKLPRLRGDVIAATLAGEAGFVYYNGAYYTWHDARRYRPEPPRRLVH